MRSLMRALAYSSGKASATAAQQWSKYQLWHANEAMLRVSAVISILMVLRLVALLTCAPQWSGTHAAALLLVAVLAAGKMRALRNSKEEKGMRYCIVVQVILITVAQLIGLLSADGGGGAGLGALGNDFMVHRWFQGPIILFMATPAMIYIPMRWYLCLLLPLHLGILTSCQYAATRSVNMRFVTQCSLQAIVNIYMYFLNDRREGGLYQSVLTTAQERQLLEAAQVVFQGMLDSLFDACCVCSGRGIISCSTPQMDQILMGAGRLGGQSLQDFASDDAERKRLDEFIANVSQCSSARKINVAMRSSGGPFEITMSGIRFGEPGGEAGETQIFIGVQVSESLPLEVQRSAVHDEYEMGKIKSIMEEKGNAIQEALMEAAKRQAGQGVHDSTEVDDEGSLLDELMSQPGCGAFSHYSAPAVLEKAPLLDFVRAARKCPADGPDGDCLPPDAVVWVEGQPLPVEVGAVKAGQRILCMDQLTGAMKFAQVVGATTRPAEETAWVEVVLEDGTQLMMTADHPVVPQGAAAEPGAAGAAPRAVRAGELQPGVHKLEVLKITAVPVRDVKVLAPPAEGSPTRAPSERVSLLVQQPERHTLFVAQGLGAGKDQKWGMAVASADLPSMPREASAGGGLVKNTFIHLRDADTEEEPTLKRSSSVPVLDAELLRSAFTSSKGKRNGSVGFGANSMTAGSVSVKSSYCSSVASRISIEDARVQVGSLAADRRTCGADSATFMSLSTVLHAQKLGLPSVGSISHHNGMCRPCLMQHWWASGKEGVEACKYGLMCSRCHECHPEQLFKQMQKERRTAQGGRVRRRHTEKDIAEKEVQ